MPDEQRQKILVLCDESGMGKGGVPVFNQQISVALAAQGHDVTLLTVKPVESEHDGVTLRTTAPLPDHVEGRDWLKQQCATRNPAELGLPDPRQQQFDLIIGHSRFSGPAAVAMRDAWYPEARVAHFLHTSPERLPQVKYADNPAKAAEKGSEHSGIERVVMARVDLVVGVGPLLTDEAKRLAAKNERVPSAHELVPGTRIEPLVQRNPQQQEGPLQLLALGRAGDPLKGFEDAARAVKLLNDQGVAVHLTVRGAPEHLVPGLQQQLSDLSGGHVTLRPFSDKPDAIANDIRNADAVVMPSKHEGFGLVATEALGHGVPVLVNEESGAARFLKDANRVPAELSASSVVPEPANPAHRVKAWAAAIHQLKEQLPQRVEQAGRLREFLKSYSWENAATALAEAASTAPVPGTGPTAAQQARATVQGPQGTVVQTSQSATQSPGSPAQGPQSPLAKAAALTSRGRSGTGGAAQGGGSGTQGPAQQRSAPAARPQVPQPPKPQGGGPSR
ncbi:hypothetical protein SGFS_071000 [Streptomyces graminofaciens]|uniref:D-inositol 3-phosphate glycosyltransferase n=1 Tax=Streptomyces graminofaciens TaxID=68212 RepID=A0ABN5VUQ8_9ACTN|nr:glycosyltransferase family 4 protein [Streptomyces graminofaciens]BBC35806.1 hypothetical protein SGFS_071000 [Streptomyces graminofaciens]